MEIYRGLLYYFFQETINFREIAVSLANPNFPTYEK